MNAIIDNMRRRVGDFLLQRVEPGSDLSIVSAYFTIYAYDALRHALGNTSRTRFLYGEPRGVGEMDPGGNRNRSFRLKEDGGIDLKQVLAQKPLARACAAWIKNQVDIRTVKQTNFLHGKLYHIAGANDDNAAIVGSSNFTRRGLGFGATAEHRAQSRSPQRKRPGVAHPVVRPLVAR